MSFPFRSTSATCLLLSVSLLGCRDEQPLEPGGPKIGSLSILTTTAGGPATGCARLEVQVRGDRTIEIHDRTSEDCGEVRPVVVGTPTFARAVGRVRIPIALENRGAKPLRAPAELIVSGDSLIVEAPSGLAYNRHTPEYLNILDADSVSTDAGRSSFHWSYNGHLSADGEGKTILPQAKSAVRWVELSVHPGVHRFRVALRAQATRIGAPVPDAAPDSLPAGLYGNPANVLTGSPYFSLSDFVLRNTVSVRFEAGTSQAVRQTLVDGVNGEVIGGQRFPRVEGYYLIRVPDDGTGLGIRAAMDKLNEDPNVAAAEPEYLHLPDSILTYAHAVDTDDWGGEWMTRPERANGKNWALEAVSAPHAWGCETGSRSTEVALLDIGYSTVPDISANTVYTQYPDRYSKWYLVGNTHGTLASSVIGARGNNRQGITGMMWNVGLRQYEVSITGDGHSTLGVKMPGWVPGPGPLPLVKALEYRLAEALESNATVINISIALYAKSSDRSLTPEQRAAQVELRAREIARMIESAPRKPLIVMGAGNRHQDAFYSTYPVVAKYIPDQVLVVAGVTSVEMGLGRLAVASGYNTNNPLTPDNLVEIAAPSTDVGALDDSGIRLMNGTSFAAPLVSGAAGLLHSFDPRLTAPEIKQLLLQGARRGGRRVTGTPGEVFVLDVYESLRLAARRPGAPLCGNRIWTQGSRIYAERRGPAGNYPELLRDMGTRVHGVIATHGGKTLMTSLEGSMDSLVWGPTGWTSHRPKWGSWGHYLGQNASLRSMLGQAHDGNTRWTAYAYNDRGTAMLWLRSPDRSLPPVPLRTLSETSTPGCLLLSVTVLVGGYRSCYLNASSYDRDIITHTAVGHSLQSDSLLVAISYGKETATLVPSGFNSAFNADAYTQHGVQESGGADVYWVDLRSGTFTKVWSEPADMVTAIAFAEMDEEIMVTRARTHWAWTYAPEVGQVMEPFQYTCDISYRAPSTGRIVATPVPTCGASTFAGFAP